MTTESAGMLSLRRAEWWNCCECECECEWACDEVGDCGLLLDLLLLEGWFPMMAGGHAGY